MLVQQSLIQPHLLHQFKPESEGVKQNYYTLDGRYIGNTRPALPGIYVVQTVNKGKLLTVKKIFIK